MAEKQDVHAQRNKIYQALDTHTILACRMSSLLVRFCTTFVDYKQKRRISALSFNAGLSQVEMLLHKVYIRIEH